MNEKVMNVFNKNNDQLDKELAPWPSVSDSFFYCEAWKVYDFS